MIEVYLDMQEQLLKKVESVQNVYSFSLFLFEHLENWELKNCRGIQEMKHECLLKGEGLSEERVKLLCGCKNVLLQCELVAWITRIQEDLVP